MLRRDWKRPEMMVPSGRKRVSGRMRTPAVKGESPWTTWRRWGMEIARTRNIPPTKNAFQRQPMVKRSSISVQGKVASVVVFAWRLWMDFSHKIKAIQRKREMMRQTSGMALVQEYAVPPSSNAVTRSTDAARRRNVPIASIRPSFCFSVCRGRASGEL